MAKRPKTRSFFALKLLGLGGFVALVVVELNSSAWQSAVRRYSHAYRTVNSQILRQASPENLDNATAVSLHFTRYGASQVITVSPNFTSSGAPQVSTVSQNFTTDVDKSSFGGNPVVTTRQDAAERVTGIPTNGSGYEVTVGVSGQMGNQMFQYASLLGIAHTNGRRPFYSMTSAVQAFKATYLQTGRSNQDFTVVSESHFATYDSKFEKLPSTNVILTQYLQSWKYFDHIRHVLAKEFAFKDDIKAAAASLLSMHVDVLRNKTLVGVHIRRGDMLIPVHVAIGYHVAPESYVKKAMELMRKRHGDVAFVIVTQDDASRTALGPCSDCLPVGSAEVQVHLALLASCRHVIMTVGTLGWWGGYLAGGEVVYYWNSSVMINNPPKVAEILVPEDFFPPTWTALGD